MKKIPNHAYVGPYTYNIELNDSVILDYEDDVCGLCDSVKQDIWLRTGLGETFERETLLHELLHAMFDMTGLSHELGVEKEENIIRRLSPVLLDFLMSNPHILPYLLGEKAN